jgi:hypothetical protein
VRNNPMRLVDPTGMIADSVLEAREEKYRRSRDSYYADSAAASWVAESSLSAPLCATCIAWQAAAAAYAEAGRAQYDAAVRALWADSYVRPEPDDGGGCSNPFGCALGAVGDGLDAVVSVGEACWDSSTCTQIIGTTVAVGGAAASPFVCGPGAPACAAGAITLGTAISTAGNIRDCQGDDQVGCGMIVPGVILGGASATSALGVRATVASIGSGSRIARTGFIVHPAADHWAASDEAMQWIGKIGYDVARNDRVGLGFDAAEIAYSGARELWDRAQ